MMIYITYMKAEDRLIMYCSFESGRPDLGRRIQWVQELILILEIRPTIYHTSTMPEFFFPLETLEFLRMCTAERFHADMNHVKESAIWAAEYCVLDRFDRYLKFVQHLV